MSDLFNSIEKTYTFYRRAGLTEDSEHGKSWSQWAAFSKKFRSLGWECWHVEDNQTNVSKSRLNHK